MFRGSFEHTMDSKGRVSVPAKFRDIIADRYDGRLVLALDFDRCLAVYPLEEWEKLEEKIRTLPMMQKEVKEFMRFFFSSASECELDKQGRILIPPTLRERAAINKTVLLVGIINKIEIWDSAVWDARNSQNLDKIGETLSSLGL
ncbi:MAG: cell division/cell wall cluster transcriptional repressor MraZ [Nitrospirae bacterium GWC2_57_13]|jgi:MraZ protein|nr:MAG: cell division/cell wall cluster transcriptional repressor MraZ [Nitrospirae bacterium GWC1_57_7]OGW27226.1 MAG: cell division/cell wall cluster transcriptional repressor MraZ [Nitrospirae bacterium GWC2_57_13]OGW45785.1 MAG: cell division/cell wall cluster transcriptional repressor MraZ [Nitrospirae bacterium GWD2_57_8]HAR45231.1 cell division/cell wall cluster transcriptional repressor MraZ [Nitrospiraceae bacterium]HAS55051.1 cell division/cell wall cluster transcriptional repressor M